MIFRTRVPWTRREQTGTNSMGNPIYAWVTKAPFYGELRPIRGSEPAVAGHERIVTGFLLFIPPDVTLTAQDRVTCFGQTYEVISHPEPHSTGGRVHHYEVEVKRITG